MKKFALLICILIGLTFSTTASDPVNFVNRIEGTVYSPERLPVENAFVELRNDIDSPIAQTKTNSSGRFTFVGMPGGRYIVKVLPLTADLAEQSQEAYVTNLVPRSSDIVYVEFYLARKKHLSETGIGKRTEVIFAQEIPPSAKKLYDQGSAELAKDKDKGLSKLEEAVKTFPDYFDALSLLGRELVLMKNYEKAYPYLLRAIDVNPKSFSCFFRLGYAFYQLKQYAAAAKAAAAAAILAPDSADTQLLLGTVARINGDLQDAERALTKANTFAKGKSSEVHWQLALLLNRLQRNREAIMELETFLKLEPNSPEKAKIQALIVKLRSTAK